MIPKSTLPFAASLTIFIVFNLLMVHLFCDDQPDVISEKNFKERNALGLTWQELMKEKSKRQEQKKVGGFRNADRKSVV